MFNSYFFRFFLFVILLSSAGGIFAQTTSFVYQGKLQDGGNSASGTYQFEIKLYDAPANGSQIGQTLTGVDAAVTSGIFAVNLDFGAGAFNGADLRFLEIGVRPGGSNQPYTVLTPRQQVTSTPYAIKALNAQTAVDADNSASLGGIPAAQYVITTDPRMSDARNPLPNSSHYVQNGTSQQAAANFNIAGDGAAKSFNTFEGYKINSLRVLNAPGTRNIFGGVGAGNSNILGGFNSFFGTEAGYSNTTGGSNSFFGDSAGRSSTTALANSFFGANAGKLTTTGGANSFFGFNAGFNNSTGINNSFFGVSAGQANSTGKNNVFVGYYAGNSNTIGQDNTFVGTDAGKDNDTAKYNSFFGARAGSKNTGGESNSFFGVNTGLNNTTASFNAFYGSNSGYQNTTGNNNSFFGYSSGYANTTGTQNAFFGTSAGGNNSTGMQNTFVGHISGIANTIGEKNAFLGTYSGQDNTTGSGNSFFGFAAGGSNISGGSNTFIGRESGSQNTTGNYNSFFGTQAGFNNTSGIHNVSLGFQSGVSNTTGGNNIYVGFSSGDGNSTGSNNMALGANTEFTTGNLQYATVIGAGASVGTDATVVLGRSADTVRVPGKLVLIGLGAAGSTTLCRNASNQISTCSSSARYKDNIENYSGGLDIIDRLRPVTFAWKADGTPDLGFVAEEINRTEPLLTVYNDKGQIEGVKYAQITTVLVNAVKEQQKRIVEQKAEIAALKALVCAQNPTATVCVTTLADVKTEVN